MPLAKKLWRFLPLLLLIVISLFLYRGLSLNPKTIPTVLLDKPAPKLGAISEAMQGRVWLLNVWASWCQGCQVEHPVMMDVAKSNIAIIGLDYRDNKANAKQWLAQYGNPYQDVIYDTDGSLAIDWGVYGAPETFVIDKKGMIRYKHIGQLTHKDYSQTIKPLLESLQ